MQNAAGVIRCSTLEGRLLLVRAPPHLQEAVHTLSVTDVCITTVGRGQMAQGGGASRL